MLEKIFRLSAARTTAGTEAIAGTVTFMTMAYIIFVNPGVLAAAGIPKDAAMVATCIGAGLATLLMGLTANYPFALAPGMGLNAFLAYSIVLGMKLPWQVAMGVVFVEGLLITVLVLTNLRERVMHAIPLNLKRAIGIGIGIFIAFIGMQYAGIVVRNDATLVSFGKMTAPVLVSLAGLAFTAFLMVRHVRGAILIGILSTTALAVIFGLSRMPQTIAALPTLSQFATIGAALTPRFLSQVFSLGLATTVFAFMMTDFFDTMGSVVAVGGEAGFLDRDGHMPRLKQVLLVDSLAAAMGGALGCSSVTTYIESAAGVGAGGRTGLASVVTALFFFLAIFFWPLVGVIPAIATAPALIIVGLLLMNVIRDIDWHDLSEAFPAFLTILTIPLTYSISRGIGMGIISHVLLKMLSGKFREIRPILWLLAVLFVIDFSL